MKATSASLHYGRGGYPVHERNLPEIAIEDAIAAVVKHMGKLSGGFSLDEPTFINLEIIGNGYTVRLEHTNEVEAEPRVTY
jgi:hypothetical protein